MKRVHQKTAFFYESVFAFTHYRIYTNKWTAESESCTCSVIWLVALLPGASVLWFSVMWLVSAIRKWLPLPSVTRVGVELLFRRSSGKEGAEPDCWLRYAWDTCRKPTITFREGILIRAHCTSYCKSHSWPVAAAVASAVSAVLAPAVASGVSWSVSGFAAVV